MTYWELCVYVYKSVDQLSVDKVLEVLSHRTDRMFDAPVDVTELSDYLLLLCGHMQTQRINAALTADLLLNWLLNVYDKLETLARSIAHLRSCATHSTAVRSEASKDALSLCGLF